VAGIGFAMIPASSISHIVSEKEKGFENLQSITLYLPTHSPSSLLFKSRSFCKTYRYKKASDTSIQGFSIFKRVLS